MNNLNMNKVMNEIKKTHTLSAFSVAYKDNVQIARELMKNAGNEYYYGMFTDAVRSDKTVLNHIMIYQKVKNRPILWEEIPSPIKTKDFILQFLRSQNIFPFLPEAFVDNEIRIAAISYHSLLYPEVAGQIECVSFSKENDMDAIRKYPKSLPYILNNKLGDIGGITINNKDVIEILKENIDLLSYIAEPIIKEMNVSNFKRIVVFNPKSIQHFPLAYLLSLSIDSLSQVIEENASLFEYLPPEIANNKRLYQVYFINSL